jgi:phosphohistidine phosphatase SixA
VPLRLYVVRHAHAGDRAAWDGHDDLRPLSAKGRKQAARIADMLEEGGMARLVSSPARRCVQTYEPFAARRGLPIDVDERLAEGHRGEEALAIVPPGDVDAALATCSHGDVVMDMLRLVKATGCKFDDPLVWPKASTWVVTRKGDRWTRARYIPPPKV